MLRHRLVAHCIDALVGALTARLRLDLLDRVSCIEVDRDGPDLRRLGQPFRHPVDHEHLRCPPQQGGIGRHQPHRAGAVHRHGLAGPHVGQLAAMVARGEDIGEHHEIGLMLFARGQHQAVEFGIGDAQVFGLAAHVRAHGHIAVGAAGEPGVHVEAEPGDSPPDSSCRSRKRH